MKMRIITRVMMGLVVAVPFFGLLSSHAAVIGFDNFDYADGSLTDNPDWTDHSGLSGDLLVSGGQAVVQHGSPSEDANRSFTSVAGDVYYGIDFSVDDLGASYTGTDNEYFAHFKDNGFNFVARLDVVEAQAGGDFTVGIASDESTADSIWFTDLTFGTTYRAVVRYDQVGNQAQLWIDPTVMGDFNILGEDRPDPGDTVTQFSLRQSDSSENETVRVDNLVLGTTFNDVVVAIPEPASLALIGLVSGGIFYTRRIFMI
jgi:hypothetical protein